MRNKKFLSGLLIGLLFLFLNLGAVNRGASAEDIDPRSGDLNLDMDLATRTPEILSGNNAIFELNLKVTGNQIEYDNVLLTIDLPDNAELISPLEELTIQEVVPIYNSEDNQLEYRIPKLLSGIAEQVLYAFKTENGLENNSQVTVSADLSADNFKPVKVSADSLVQSTLDQTLKKTYTQTVGPDNQVVNRAPIQNDTGEWLLSLNISNKAVGQEYLQPGSMITITDTLPNGLAYISDDQNGKYNGSTRAITWEFEVPSIAEQQTTDSIFFLEIKLKTKFITKQTANATTISNTMKTTVTDTSGQISQKESKASVNQGPGSDGAPTTPSNGQQFIFVHYGPLDGAGNGPGATNPNPTVGPGSLLMFYVTQAPYTADSPTKDFTSYEMNYKIDDKLALVRLKESDIIRFRPNASFPEGVNLPPDANILDIYATVNKVEKKIITGFIPGKTYERSEFENYQSTNDHISTLRYVSRYRHAGAATYQALYFTPEEGASGRATNQVNFNYKGFNFKGDGVTYTSNYTTGIFADASSTTGPRYVNISQNMTNMAKPIVSTAIEFSKHSNGIIDEGENQVSGQLILGKTNKMVIAAPFSAYVILPKGIHYQISDEKTTESSDYQVEMIDPNYNHSTQELVRVNWHRTSPLLTGESLTFKFAVNVTQETPTVLTPTMYTYIGTKEFEVPSYSSEALTNTSIVSNTLNLNGSGDQHERVLLTKNQYSILRSNKIVGKELIKGELDKEYSTFGYTNLDGEMNYRIELTNYGNSGKDFLLMNVLPSVGDLGITDNAPLNTLFEPILKGPITLPSDTADEYVVYYSTSKNPSRKKMIDLVDWPSTTEKMQDPPGAEDPKWMKEEQVKDWSKIHSFMVEGLAEYPIIHEEKLTIDFKMKAPKELSGHLLDSNTPGKERAAWNSFAYTINHLQPVEPAKIGIAVNQSAYNLKIVKEESTSDKKIAATEFTLYDADQFILESGVSDKDGEINFDNLAAGTYYLQETNARPGYALNNKMYELEIMADGTIEIKNRDAFIKEVIPADQASPTIVVTIGNDSKLGLPETGSPKLIVISAVSFILLGVSIFYYTKRREVN